MPDLHGQLGELRLSVEIKRKESGEVEKFDLIGTTTKEQAEALGICTDGQPEFKEPQTDASAS